MRRSRRCLSNSSLALLATLLLGACAHAPALAPATTRPASRITDLDRRPYDPFAKVGRATVLLFITNDCPISNGYAPEIHRLCDAYARQDIAFCLVYADPTITAAAARQHYRDYGYTCPAVLDPGHELATRAGATVTPEAAVFLADGKLVYRGRIDDLYLDYGKARFVATTHDLRDALDAVAGGKPMKLRTTVAVGCHIPM